MNGGAKRSKNPTSHIIMKARSSERKRFRGPADRLIVYYADASEEELNL
jgi:hypothetical protein